jgi:hypothetical protein
MNTRHFARLAPFALFFSLVGCNLSDENDPSCEGNIAYTHLCEESCWDIEIDCNTTAVESSCAIEPLGARCVPVADVPSPSGAPAVLWRTPGAVLSAASGHISFNGLETRLPADAETEEIRSENTEESFFRAEWTAGGHRWGVWTSFTLDRDTWGTSWVTVSVDGDFEHFYGPVVRAPLGEWFSGDLEFVGEAGNRMVVEGARIRALK